VSKEVSLLRGLYAFLLHDGRNTTNPAALLAGPTVHNSHPKPVSDHVWLTLWQWPQLDEVERVAWALGFYFGLRRREVCELTPRNVDRGRLVKFMRKGRQDDIVDCSQILDVFAAKLPHLLPDGPRAVLEPLEGLVRARRGEPFLMPWATGLAHHVNERLLALSSNA
jgi:integrase